VKQTQKDKMAWSRCEQEKVGALLLHNLFLSVRSSIEKVPQAFPGPSLGGIRAQMRSRLLQSWQAWTHAVLCP